MTTGWVFLRGPQPSVFRPWGRPYHGVYLIVNEAPTVCWAHGHSEASKFPVLTVYGPDNTQDRVLPLVSPHYRPPTVGPCGRRQRSPDPGPQVLAAHQDCHSSKPVSYKGRWGSLSLKAGWLSRGSLLSLLGLHPTAPPSAMLPVGD